MKKKNKMSTSKKLIHFLFLNCTLIELFTVWVTIQSLHLAENLLIVPDFTPLVTMIGVVIGEVIGYAVYAIKSAKENSKGGIIFETAAHNNFENNSIDGVG